MKISEVDVEYVKGYLRIPLDDTDDDVLIEGIMSAALSYVSSHVGMTADELDDHSDITIAYLILCEDMYDNRSATVSNANVNRTLDTILSLHSQNNVG